jgi:endogenous inhibitor of DNA gyrase (YacG/DUF329 family)
MREIAIRCPTTGLPVATGEKTAGKLANPAVLRILRECPVCNQPHEWRARDAWLIEEMSERPPDDDPDAVLL